MKAISLTGLKLLGLVLVYLEVSPNQVLGFFLLLSLINLWLLRLNFDGRVFVNFTYLVDSLLLFFMGNVLLIGFIVVPEVFHQWLSKEHLHGLEIRDKKTLELHDKENLIMELMTAQHQIEQLTKVTERARISADIHDHAGHDIMGAFMAFQMLSNEVTDELFEEALKRLEIGVEKIRTAVHNIKPDGIFGIHAFKKVVVGFKEPTPDLRIYGDFNQINQLHYAILEAVLKEGLTNIAKHATPSYIHVELTITPRLTHFKMENDGVRLNPMPQEAQEGIGMKNLRRRAESVGGTFHTRKEGETFYLTLTLLK
jgi:signal transduction histidine kinase